MFSVFNSVCPLRLADFGLVKYVDRQIQLLFSGYLLRLDFAARDAHTQHATHSHTHTHMHVPTALVHTHTNAAS